MGQVNCAENGDLCSSQGVTHYPSLFLYEDGVLVDKYDGARDIQSIGDYIKQHATIEIASGIAAVAIGPLHSSPIDSNKVEEFVHVLEREHLIDLKHKTSVPSFVEYYAPW